MTETTEKVYDEAKADAFVEKIAGVLNAGALNLMISIGHRSRLFDVMATMKASTSEEISQKAGLNERYVREWLGAMVTGRIVLFDPKESTYVLPPEHAAALTREAVPDNLAVTAQWLPVMAKVEDRILECFHNGGGVHYSAYERFHKTMAEESGQSVVSALLEHIIPLAAKSAPMLGEGADVLEIGCGAGRALNELAAAFPRSRFTGLDFSEEAIQLARDESKSRGIENVQFKVQDVSCLGASEAYDLITAFDTIHDQAKPAVVLAEVSKALRPGGTFLMQDIRASSHVEKNLDHPMGTFLYTISCMHCMTVSLALGGAGLGAVWGEELALQMLREAGFTNVDVHQLPHDVMNNYYVATKD